MSDEPRKGADRANDRHEEARPGGSAPQTAGSNADQAKAEREALLEERRARQTGGRKRARNNRSTMAGLVLAGGLSVFVFAVGPGKALQILGITKVDEGQKTSQVGLKVDKETKEKVRLDFVVPAEDKTDPNAEWTRRFEELKKQLDAVARANKPPEVSLADVKSLMDRYNQDMNQRMREERERMEAENTRIRDEAQRQENERRQAEEEARRGAEQRKKLDAVDAKQRESNGVVIDESNNRYAEGGATQGTDLNADQRFLASASQSVFETSVSRPLADPRRTVVQGTIISAVLETAIDTELPGNIRAQVIEPVFSFDGSRILMPTGTVLIGTFNNQVQVAQKRVLIAWNRAVTPEGKSIALGSVGTDVLGRSGTTGNVDNRYRTKFGAALLISAISALPTALSKLGSRNSQPSSGTTVNIGGGAGSGGGDVAGQLAAGMGGQVAQQGQSVLEKYLSLPPVIRVPQGEEIRVFVNRDLVIR